MTDRTAMAKGEKSRFPAGMTGKQIPCGNDRQKERQTERTTDRKSDRQKDD
jgi:hypothetical protein